MAGKLVHAAESFGRAVLQSRSWVYLTGIWTMQTWIFCSIYPQPDSYNDYINYVNKQTMQVVTLAVVALVYSGFHLKDRGKFLDWPVAVLMSAGTVLCTITLVTHAYFSLSLAGVLLAGVGVGWGYLRWGYLFSRLDTRSVLIYAFGAGVIASVCKAFLQVVPQVLVNICCVVLPLLSTYLLHKGLQIEPDDTSVTFFSKKDVRRMSKPAICLMVFCVLISICEVSFNENVGLTMVSFQIVGRMVEIGLFILMICAIMRNKPFGFSQLWFIIFLISGTSILISAVSAYQGTAAVLIGISVNLVVYYFWVALADIAHHSEVDPYVVFSIGWLIYAIPRALRGILYSSVADFASPHVLTFAILYGIALISCYLLAGDTPYIRRSFSELDKASDVRDRIPSLESRCSRLAVAFSLTKREAQILLLLCRGRSRGYIAESLYVTENTIKGHVHRLYRKLGVHNRQELINLVEMDEGTVK